MSKEPSTTDEELGGKVKEKEELKKKTWLEEKRAIIKEANEATEKLEQANKIQEELQEKQIDINAETQKGGLADAGQAEIKKEETPQEYKDKVMRGDLDDNAT
jgi:cell fate (sporulation/competence/biofilm development) regulator YlbF (YheA/YmcA/DUF963 family)|tara:strand:- start:503 stop:811 length:309 start_codon:yes stop_codon:yes gene_type:complete